MKKPGIYSILRRLLVITLSLGVLSCAKDSEAFIDEELVPYFTLFEQEAAIRNITIDLDVLNVGGLIENIDDSNTAGQCQTSSEGNKRVIIDISHWQDYDPLEKEFVVFHELGHCVLGRTHDDAADNKNNCISIMQSGMGNCRNNYKLSTRTAYLDELFNY